MEITLLRQDKKLVGAYLDNGILLDAPIGIGEMVKSLGLNPHTVLLTNPNGEAGAGIDELSGIKIGSTDDQTIEKFSVGAKGPRQYGYRIKTSDGELVYAPSFDRVEKSRISGADLAILDAGDRGETGDPVGLSHKSYTARYRMVENAKVKNTIWTDSLPKGSVELVAGKMATEEAPATKVNKELDIYGEYSAIREAFADFDFGVAIETDDSYVRAAYADRVIVCFYNDDYTDSTLYEIGYTVENGVYKFDGYGSWVEVKTDTNYLPVAKSQMLVEKDDNGNYAWTSISSSDFRDVDNEVVSTMAMDFAIEVNKKRGSYGELVWEHYDDLAVGVCKEQTRVGRFLVEKGTFYDTPLGRKAAEAMKSAAPGKYRVSIGFNYWKGTRSDDGEYSLIDIYHRAVTTHPANPFTSIEVNKTMNKQLTPDVMARVKSDLGLTDTELTEIMAKVGVNVANKSEDTETVHKDDAKAEEVKTEEVKSEEVAKEAPVAPDITALLARIDQLESKQKSLEGELTASETRTREEVLKAINSAPKDEVVNRSTEKGTELTAEEKQKLVDDAKKTTEKSEKTRAGGGWMDADFYKTFSSKGA